MRMHLSPVNRLFQHALLVPGEEKNSTQRGARLQYKLPNKNEVIDVSAEKGFSS